MESTMTRRQRLAAKRQAAFNRKFNRPALKPMAIRNRIEPPTPLCTQQIGSHIRHCTP
jgi:hypothetical protein